MPAWASVRQWLTAVVVAAVSAGTLGGCTSTGSGAASSPASARSTHASVPGSTPAGPVTGRSEDVTVTDRASLRPSVALRVGQRLRVVLGSTYWRFDPLPANRAVEPAGSATITPDPHCIPGGGCGTVERRYVAVGSGRATITASRTGCGEALACAPARRHFVLTVTVLA
jgi:hypothetical protein